MKQGLSEFMDGELPPERARRVLEALGRDEETRQAWRTYHLIGDVLRGELALRHDIASRVQERLRGEPVCVAPLRRPMLHAVPMALTAGVAVVAAGVLVLALYGQRPPEAPIAQTSASAGVAPERNAELAQVPPPAAAHDYLVAHQAYSARAPLQGVTPYVPAVMLAAERR